MKLCAVHSADTIDSNGWKQKRGNRCQSSSKHSAKTPVRHLGNRWVLCMDMISNMASYSGNLDFPKPAKPPCRALCRLCPVCQFLVEESCPGPLQWGGGSVKCTCALKLSCFSLMLERWAVFSSEAHLDWELQHWKLCILPFEELQSSEVCPSGCSLPALQTELHYSFHRIYVRSLGVFTVNCQREISLW